MKVIHSGRATRCEVGWLGRGNISGTFTVTVETFLFEPHGASKFRTEWLREDVREIRSLAFGKCLPNWLDFLSSVRQGIAVIRTDGTELHLISLDVPADLLVQKLNDFLCGRSCLP
ncbi:MAG: hypothetical protein R3C49_04280 [Planctomycetaceae bacterium]